jgi:hypothetical protein
VRAITLTPGMVAATAGVALLVVTWLFASTAYLLFHQEIREASHFYHIEKQRAYEDRIAVLRRQIDTINSRQFLDQAAFEKRMVELRRRQIALEERQTQISGVLESADERDLSIRIEPDGGEREHAALPGTPLVTGSLSAAPQLTARPLPADDGAGMGLPSAVRDPASYSLAEIEDSIDRLYDGQGDLLNRFEASLVKTVEQLVSVPKAIGASLPHFDDGDGGIGGPFIELRGTDQPIAIEDQIERIERKMERISTLGSHVRRLPVRVPLEENARITSGFGSRIDPFLGRRAMHTGIDFRASTGTPVLAAAAGRVVRAGRLGGYGNLIEIDHGGGYTTRYAHLSRIDVKRGQTVSPGELIGAAGSTGRSTGPHLHYETRIKGRAVDPTPFVRAAELLPEGF